MPTFKNATEDVTSLANEILKKYETHELLLNCGARIDYVFAFADIDPDSQQQINDAITIRGHKALGVTRKIPLKDRAMGRGDAEITLDGDWWMKASVDERVALLDHELHHLQPKLKNGRDDLGRPLFILRKHDFEVGWFHVIASRHGKASIERQQAKTLMDSYGQIYWDLDAERAKGKRFAQIANETEKPAARA